MLVNPLIRLAYYILHMQDLLENPIIVRYIYLSGSRLLGWLKWWRQFQSQNQTTGTQDVALKELEYLMLTEYCWIEILIDQLPEVLYTNKKHQYDHSWVICDDRDSSNIKTGPNIHKILVFRWIFCYFTLHFTMQG